MTFFIEAKKDGQDASTIRARAPNALHVARKLLDDGWSVSGTCPEGSLYWPAQFDLLLGKYADKPDVPHNSMLGSSTEL